MSEDNLNCTGTSRRRNDIKSKIPIQYFLVAHRKRLVLFGQFGGAFRYACGFSHTKYLFPIFERLTVTHCSPFYRR